VRRPRETARTACCPTQALRAAPHRSASDLLAVAPGVAVTQHGGQGKAHQLFLRGFDAGHGQEVALWVAGAPVNEVSNIHEHGYADLHFVMPEVVREVRATAGPWDARQGDFAVAGSFELALGYAEPGVHSSVSAGSFGERRYFVAVHPEGTAAGTFAAFEAQATEGFGVARAARRTSGLAQGEFTLDDGLVARVMASAYAATFASAGFLRKDALASGAIDRFGSYDASQGGASSRAQVVLALEGESPEAQSGWSVAPYGVARSLHLRSNYTGFLERAELGDVTEQRNESITLGGRGHYRKRLALVSDDDRIEAGFSARHDWIRQSDERPAAGRDVPAEPRIDAALRALSVGSYAELSVRPAGRLTLRAGARVEGVALRADDAVASLGPREGLGIHVGKKASAELDLGAGLTLLARYGEGFRSPEARSIEDGESLHFTSVRAGEGGLRYANGRSLRASLLGFVSDLDEDLVFDGASARTERVPATRRVGVVAEVTAEPRPWLVGSGSVTYARGFFTEGNDLHAAGSPVPYAPRLVARADLGATPVVGRLLERDVTLHAGSALSLLAARPLPFVGGFGRDTFLVDLSLGARVGAVELRVDTWNVLDAEWFDGELVYASSFTRGEPKNLVPETHVTAGAPRTVMGSLTLHL
jgi:iron complex outermembrane receptor protein